MCNICESNEHLISFLPSLSMKTKSGQLPLFGTADSLGLYLILIPLPESVINDVQEIRRIFREKHGSFSSEQSTPHLPVCSFLLMENRSADTFSKLQQRLDPIPSFKMRIEGFGTFENSRSVFLNLLPSSPFDSIIREMDEARRDLHIRKNYTASPTPHITIAKGLEKSTFETARQEWSRQKYKGIIEVDTLTVLSFDFEDKQYRRYSELKLNN